MRRCARSRRHTRAASANAGACCTIRALRRSATIRGSRRSRSGSGTTSPRRARSSPTERPRDEAATIAVFEGAAMGTERYAVGFVGLGAMGAHMARHLHARGLLHGVCNRTHAKAEALANELGVEAYRD